MAGPLLSIGKGKFLKRNQKINEPPYKLHHMFVMKANPQNIAA